MRIAGKGYRNKLLLHILQIISLSIERLLRKRLLY